MYETTINNHHPTLYKDAQCSLLSSMPILLEYLTIEEEIQIHQRFLGDEWRPNGQVLWSGMQRMEAQKWADEHGMQTLTTAMGPLMDAKNPLCFKSEKIKTGMEQIHKRCICRLCGCISRAEKVTVLTPPPLERFHPSGHTNYQSIEEPILKWAAKTHALLRIEMVHPEVQGAGDFSYQIWPVDEIATWTAVFGLASLKNHHWRRVKLDPWQIAIRNSIEAEEENDVRHEPNHSNNESESHLNTPTVARDEKEDKRKQEKICTVRNPSKHTNTSEMRTTKMKAALKEKKALKGQSHTVIPTSLPNQSPEID